MSDVSNESVQKICRYFKRGSCKHGTSCRFLHIPSIAVEEVDDGVVLCGDFVIDACYDGAACKFEHRHPRDIFEQRKVTCYYFQRGICQRGNGCKYSHALPTKRPQKKTICKFSLRGSCMFGDNCLNSHNYKEIQRLCGSNYVDLDSASSTNIQDKSNLVYVEKSVDSDLKSQNLAELPGIQISPSSDLCPYFDLRCPNISKCEFRHGDYCEFCLEQRLHPFDEKLKEKHINECIKATEISKDKSCSICLENICQKLRGDMHRFGILENCNHVFCWNCIKNWRKKKTILGENMHYLTTLGCPECREISSCVIPSRYWVVGEDKKAVIYRYRLVCSRISCDYVFKGNGVCPHAHFCFFSHDSPPL